MIKHIVMFKLNDPADGERIQAKAEELLRDVPTLKKMETAVNSKAAPGSNFEFVLICDFDSIEDLNAYQVHPLHKKFGEFISPLRTENGRACIDYEY